MDEPLDDRHRRHFMSERCVAGNCLGRGSFGQVWTVTSRRENKERAVKIMDLKSSMRDTSLPNVHAVGDPPRERPRFGQLEEQFDAMNLNPQPVFLKDLRPDYLVVASNTRGDAQRQQAVIEESRVRDRRDRYLKTELKVAEILKQSDHPNVVKVFDVKLSDTHAYIYMEHCDSGTLFEYLKFENTNGQVLHDKIVRHWSRQIVDGLNFLHTKLYIAHRDLKLDNIGLDEDLNCKIFDFGFACNIRGRKKVREPKRTSSFGRLWSPCVDPEEQTSEYEVEHHGSFCGTKAYMAPEVMMAYASGSRYDPAKADMYSFGICVYNLYTNRVPYTNKIYDNILRQTWQKKSVYSCISIDGFALLSNLLHPSAWDRFTAQQALDHPFCALQRDMI